MNYYYLDGEGEVVGPISEATLRELHKIGRLLDTTRICREGTNEWVSLGSELYETESEQAEYLPAEQAKSPSAKGKGKLATALVIVVSVVCGAALVVKSLGSNGSDSTDVSKQEPQKPQEPVVETSSSGGASSIGDTDSSTEPDKIETTSEPSLPADIEAVIGESQKRIYTALVTPPYLWPPGENERKEAAARAESLVHDALAHTKVKHETHESSRARGRDIGPAPTFEEILLELEGGYLTFRKNYPARLTLMGGRDLLGDDVRSEAESILSKFRTRQSPVEHRALEFFARNLLVRAGRLVRREFVIPKRLGTVHPSQTWNPPSQTSDHAASSDDSKTTQTKKNTDSASSDALTEYYSNLGLSGEEITMMTEYFGGELRHKEPADLFNLLAGLYELKPSFNGEQCIHWLVKAAEAGSAEAMYRLHQILHPNFPLADRGYPIGDEDESRYWAHESAKHGSARGMVAMGLYCWYGSYNHDGTKFLMDPDKRKAVDWWTKAARQGSTGQSSEAKSLLDDFQREIDALAESEPSTQEQPTPLEEDTEGTATLEASKWKWVNGGGKLTLFGDGTATHSKRKNSPGKWQRLPNNKMFLSLGAHDYTIAFGDNGVGIVTHLASGNRTKVIPLDTIQSSKDQSIPSQDTTESSAPPPIDAALPAIKVFQRGTLAEAQECVRLLDEVLTKDSENFRIKKVRATIADIFREETSLVASKHRFAEAEKLVEVETRNLSISSRPSGLSGKVNRDEVAKYKRRVSAAKAALEEAKKEGMANRARLKKLLNSSLNTLPMEEGELLAPVWRQVARRNGITLSK